MPARILTVSEINNFIKRLFEQNSILKRVSVEGEISNLTRASSGHYYFSLKDPSSEIRCILWRSSAQRLRFLPEDGLKVKVTGSVEVYAQRGTYSIIISSLEPSGVGSLYMLYQKYLESLKEKGWLEQELKKELPEQIKRVGVVTSETGAVIHDIITTIKRRNPLLEVVLVPALVQGEGSAQSVAQGIKQLNETGDVDVIIVGRGGGSMEDLWSFNEPEVAQAIHESNLPIISAVGHETDVTISDFVADLRAPTPTAAAEYVSGGLIQTVNQINALSDKMTHSLVNLYNIAVTRLDRAKQRIIVSSPESQLKQIQLRIDELDMRMRSVMERKIERLTARVEALKTKIELLNPRFMFDRGYAMITNKDDVIVRSTEEAYKDKDLILHFADGNVEAVVKENPNE